jgi:hypothetical protein
MLVVVLPLLFSSGGGGCMQWNLFLGLIFGTGVVLNGHNVPHLSFSSTGVRS